MNKLTKCCQKRTEFLSKVSKLKKYGATGAKKIIAELPRKNCSFALFDRLLQSGAICKSECIAAR